jgi:hypothetical protein
MAMLRVGGNQELCAVGAARASADDFIALADAMPRP